MQLEIKRSKYANKKTVEEMMAGLTGLLGSFSTNIMHGSISYHHLHNFEMLTFF